MSPKARESVITSVVLLIIYGFLFAQTMGMPSTPALFPRVCLILLTVLNLIQNVKSQYAGKYDLRTVTKRDLPRCSIAPNP